MQFFEGTVAFRVIQEMHNVSVEWPQEKNRSVGRSS